MARSAPPSDPQENAAELRRRRGSPVVTLVVLTLCALIAAVLFRQLQASSSSPEAQGAADAVTAQSSAR